MKNIRPTWRKLLAAAIGIPLCAIAQTAYADMTIRVEITGETPHGRFWDGRSIYAAPVQMGSYSPPDLVICSITINTGTCYLRSGAEQVSLCPDRNWCEFQIPDVNGHPFGIVIFDLDNFGRKTIRNSLTSASDWIARYAYGNDSAIRSAAAAAKDQLDKATAENERRFEYIDAITFAGSGSDAQVQVIQQRIRNLVTSSAAFGMGVNPEQSRISGPIEIKQLEECAFPAPPCKLDYSFIELTLEEIY